MTVRMADENGFTIRRRDELERSGRWLLARRSIGLKSFGMNVVEIEPGDRIPEHDETERDQEEVFVVLSGNATMVVDGKKYPAPAGTFVRVDPPHLRTIVNVGEGVASVLIVSAPTTRGFEPDTWN
jgi:mannose-6-phosphate isomerase-like protein (cupin superfamily)